MAMIIGIAKKANLKEIVVTLDDKSPTKVAEEFLVRKKFDQVISNLKVEGKDKEEPKEKVEEAPKPMGLMTKEIEGEE